MNCPNCSLTNIKTETVTEWVPYGEIERAFQATFPVMTCNDCTFGWRDYRAEEAIDAAMQDYLAKVDTDEAQRIVQFTDKVRELLDESMKPDDNRESFREALLLLAAQL